VTATGEGTRQAMRVATHLPAGPSSHAAARAQLTRPHVGRRGALVSALLASVVLALSLLGTVGAAPATATRLDVVVWGQKDPRWASHHLNGSFRTMGGSGCALTSAAMIAEYFGSTKNPDQLRLALEAGRGLDSSGSRRSPGRPEDPSPSPAGTGPIWRWCDESWMPVTRSSPG
jgi:hypothetical protein